jgi:hypothetical protein
VVLRRIVAVDGDAQVRVRLAVRAGFGAHPMTVEDRRDHGFTATSGPIRMRWHAGWRFAFAADGTAESVITIPAGSTHDLILELGDRPLPVSRLDADDAWHATESAWHQSVPVFGGTLADRDVRHAYAVLRGLTGTGGGMAAAATMSLPERAEQGRNYDYPYAWVPLQRPRVSAIGRSGRSRGRRPAAVPPAHGRRWVPRPARVTWAV